jgi:tight adherence protein B
MTGHVVTAAAGAAGLLAALAVLVLPARSEQAARRLLVSEPPNPGGVPRDLDVADLAEQLAAAFRAGLPPMRAWEVLAERPGSFASLADAVSRRVGLGMPAGWSLWQAAGPGRSAVAPLAVAFDLCERSGAPAAEVLVGLAAGLRAEAAAATEARIALAAPKATATVMSLLPVAGLGLGALLGVDTVRVLLGTPPGHACLVLGAAAWVTGRWWIRRLVAAAQPAGDDG